MAKKKEELKVESLEEEVQELKRDLLGVFESFIPPKEVREEIIKNIYTIELSFLKIFKALLDYQVESLEKKVSKNGSKKKAKKIEIE
ncbi:MAG: hypothetical protein GXO18_00440 [Aquificae bacterium]|nr:hypothetical protein [Aquificota bacterium]